MHSVPSIPYWASRPPKHVSLSHCKDTRPPELRDINVETLDNLPEESTEKRLV